MPHRFRKIHGLLKCVFLAPAAWLLVACEATIPTTDNTRPEISLTISGPGIERQELTNPPRESWESPGGGQLFEMLPDSEYRFDLLVSDQGGVSRAHLRMPVDFEVSNLSPDSVDQTSAPLMHSLTVTGTRSDPKTGLTISGRFRTPELSGTLLSFEFLVEGDDFGGVAGRPNQRFMSVVAAVNGSL